MDGLLPPQMQASPLSTAAASNNPPHSDRPHGTTRHGQHSSETAHALSQIRQQVANLEVDLQSLRLQLTTLGPATSVQPSDLLPAVTSACDRLGIIHALLPALATYTMDPPPTQPPSADAPDPQSSGTLAPISFSATPQPHKPRTHCPSPTPPPQPTTEVMPHSSNLNASPSPSTSCNPQHDTPLNLLGLPNAPLRTILHLSGPRTRLTCCRFHQTYGPPTHLTPRPTPTLRTTSEMLSALLSLPALPHTRTLDLTHLPTPTRSNLLLALASACPSLTGITHSGGLLTAEELSALVTHRGPALHHLHGLSFGRPPRSRQTPADPTLLLQCTALQTLHIQRAQNASTLPTAAIRCLATLRTLSFAPKACSGRRGPRAVATMALEVLEAAAQLPHLDTLELPTYDVVWDDAAAAVLGALTRLTALQVGTCNVAGTKATCGAALVAAVAGLPRLRRLTAVDPGWWVPAASCGVLDRLSQLEALGVVVLNKEVEDGEEDYPTALMGGLNQRGVRAPLTELLVNARAGTLVLTVAAFEGLVAPYRHSLGTVILRHALLPLACCNVLAGLPLLRRLVLEQVECLTSDLEPMEIDQFCPNLRALTTLTSLSLSMQGQMRSYFPPELTCLTALRELHLPDWAPLRPADAMVLLQLPRLQVLGLYGPLLDTKGRHICGVLQQLSALRRVSAQRAYEYKDEQVNVDLLPCYATADDVRRLAPRVDLAERLELSRFGAWQWQQLDAAA